MTLKYIDRELVKLSGVNGCAEWKIFDVSEIDTDTVITIVNDHIKVNDFVIKSVKFKSGGFIDFPNAGFSGLKMNKYKDREDEDCIDIVSEEHIGRTWKAEHLSLNDAKLVDEIKKELLKQSAMIQQNQLMLKGIKHVIDKIVGDDYDFMAGETIIKLDLD